MGSGFESQGAHIKKDPADSSESAGFLRSPRKRLEKLGGIDISPCSYRGPVLAELGHPDVAAGNIYTPACLWFRGSWNPAGFCGGIVVVQCVRPVPSELGWGRLSPFWSVAWWLGVLRAGTRKPATVTQQQRANAKLNYRTGQIRVTNSRKSFTSLPCSSRPVP